MKVIRFMTHPLVLISSFLLILISGQHFGGFYLLYILLALPHGGLHALLAIGGILILLFSFYKFKRSNKYVAEAIINLTGSVILVASLFAFFCRGDHYNQGTFGQWTPMVTLLVFGVLVIVFALYNIVRTLTGRKPGKRPPAVSH